SARQDLAQEQLHGRARLALASRTRDHDQAVRRHVVGREELLLARPKAGPVVLEVGERARLRRESLVHVLTLLRRQSAQAVGERARHGDGSENGRWQWTQIPRRAASASRWRTYSSILRTVSPSASRRRAAISSAVGGCASPAWVICFAIARA